MLPPFRIRYLRASQNPSGPDLGDDYLSSSPEAGIGAVVQITGPQYDKIISAHPDAILTYMDEDDGEVITVSFF
jgi:hypothetical protein